MIRLVVNWAPLVGDRAGRQQAAWNTIEKLAERNDDFVASTVICPGDPEVGAPRLSGILPRKIGRRNLPFIRDLLDHVRAGAAGDDWIGFLNSDIVLTPAFLERVRGATNDLVLCNVTDVTALGLPGVMRPKMGWSIDGILLRSSTWDRIRDLLPELVLGADTWDGVVVLWALQTRNTMTWMERGDCLHVRHPIKHWMGEKGRDPASRVNLTALDTVGGMRKIREVFAHLLKNPAAKVKAARSGAPYRRRNQGSPR